MAVNAVRVRMDWRPLLGLTPDDAGSPWEMVATRVVLGAVVEAHNADVEKANRAAKR